MTQKKAPLIRRTGQIIFAIELALVLVGLATMLIRDIEPPSSDIAGLWIMWPLSALVYSVLALLIISRQPRHVVGWLFHITGIFTAVTVFFFGLVDFESEIRPEALRIFLGTFGELFWIVALIVPLTMVPQFFPDGRLPSRRWWPIPAATVFSIFGGWSEYLPLSESLSRLLDVVGFIVFPVVVLGTMALVVVRYIRSTGRQRTQLKWLVYTVVVGFLVGYLLLQIFEDNETPIISYYFTSLPTLIAAAVGLAILRYRLYDIDIIIRRTLQYGILTAILVMIYFGLVIMFQSIFVDIGGQQSPIIIVISTLAVAALFNPLRNRIQSVIDRRFYRRKYDAQQVLEQFAAVARDEVDLEKLTNELLDVVQQTIQPEQMGITWIMDK